MRARTTLASGLLVTLILLPPPAAAEGNPPILITPDGGTVTYDEELERPDTGEDQPSDGEDDRARKRSSQSANGHAGSRHSLPTSPNSTNRAEPSGSEPINWEDAAIPATVRAACEIGAGAAACSDPAPEGQVVEEASQAVPPPPLGDVVESQTDPTAAALTLIAEIDFAGGAPEIGPPADINPWDIYVVGYPYWFWTDGPTSLSDSQESMGVEVSLDASATSVTFDTGDGGSVTCDPASAPSWSRSVGAEEPSPSCGYTWEKRSATPDHPDATHTVTATTTWEVDWTAGDASGTETVQRSQSVDVVVGELQALVTG